MYVDIIIAIILILHTDRGCIVYVCMCVFMHVFVCECVCVHACVCVCVYVVHICTHACMRVCMHVCIHMVMVCASRLPMTSCGAFPNPPQTYETPSMYPVRYIM